jgi:hypothetical protein
MPRTRLLSSTRARSAATAATVFALVALGGVAAAPAQADVNVYVKVIDGHTGNPFANQNLQFGPTGLPYLVTSDVSGGFGFGGPSWPDGSYSLVNPDSGLYVNPAPLMLDGSSSTVTITLERYKVSGSIAADAGSGLTAVTIERNYGGWSSVGSDTVTSATGDFVISMPNGPGEYRLRFAPDSSTDYLETVSSPFTFDGSVGIIDIGSVALTQAPTIRGTVRMAADSAPLAGASVYAAVGGIDVASATADGSGAYRLVLPVGAASYTVRVEATGFITQTDTVDLNATAGWARTGIDFSVVGEPVVISGTIAYYHLLSETPQVSLYSGGTAPTLIEAQATIVTSGIYGYYSFPAVPAGDYYIEVIPSDNDHFLPVLLGDANATQWSFNPSVDAAFVEHHSFRVISTDPTTGTGHDLNLVLVEASFLNGLLQAPGNEDPIDGCVQVTDVADPLRTLCAPTDANGNFSAKVPTGGSYTLEARPSSNRYLSEWWQQTQDSTLATVVTPTTRGFYSSHTFFIQLAPATLLVDAVDVAAVDPITAHLFYRPAGTTNWTPVATATTDPAQSSTSVTFADVSDGEYRLRFQDSNGLWLAAAMYDSGIEPDSTTTTGPVCFIDVFDVTDGAPNFVNAIFDSANQSTTCGEQDYEYGAIEGTVVASADFLSVPVENHLVTLTEESTGTSRSVTTAADGSFTFSYVPNSTYTLEVTPTAHVAGEHEYSYFATGLALGNGDLDLGALVATRYGNVTGTISNWAAAGTTGTVTVYFEDTCGCWTPGPLTVDIEADGSFEVPGIDLDGQYAVRVDFDSDYAPVFLGGGHAEPTSPFTGTAEQDYSLGALTVDLVEYATISGYVTFNGAPVANAVVLAFPPDSDGLNTSFGLTDSDGFYELDAVPGMDYALFAVSLEPGVQMQGYGGYNYPVTYSGTPHSDLVHVAGSAVTDINFALVAADVVFDLAVTQWSATAPHYINYPGVDVHIFTKVAGHWTQVETVTADSDGYAYTELANSGEYRLQFSRNGVALAVHDVYSELYYPFSAYVMADENFNPAACFLDLGSLADGSYYYSDISLVAAPVGSECGAAAPVIPSSGTKPTGAAVNELVELAEQLAEETEAPDSTAGGSDSGAGQADGGSDVDTPAAASTAPDLVWVFWLSGALGLLVLAGGAVFLVRARP